MLIIGNGEDANNMIWVYRLDKSVGQYKLTQPIMPPNPLTSDNFFGAGIAISP